MLTINLWLVKWQSCFKILNNLQHNAREGQVKGEINILFFITIISDYLNTFIYCFLEIYKLYGKLSLLL